MPTHVLLFSGAHVTFPHSMQPGKFSDGYGASECKECEVGIFFRAFLGFLFTSVPMWRMQLIIIMQSSLLLILSCYVSARLASTSVSQA